MNFKKHITFLLSFLLLVSNTGLAVNVHYCMDKIAEVSFAYKLEEPCDTHHHNQDKEQHEKACCAEPGESHDTCCKDDVLKLKQDNQDNIIIKSIQFDLTQFYIAESWNPSLFFTQDTFVKKEIPSFYCRANAPPLFKLYCRYIFYA